MCPFFGTSQKMFLCLCMCVKGGSRQNAYAARFTVPSHFPAKRREATLLLAKGGGGYNQYNKSPTSVVYLPLLVHALCFPFS